ncbi:PEP-CTERM sorting domain-containing protein [Roseofilum sp. BLCC_M91]|uniref:PEP-CTERM sorting domain-containing protein n=1 Tax=Roseofilum halophilum BLCC-M91 TaxID=3022259 RepID=A0ABT7BKB7_9CYAN|nr:PEP-CTERM sorting domain-containing protein [Roseofilum halophilum]MDJ1179638.1 PEP-CTERM sorting domain-containing protein [Roseofilum halophilum BLCC-M91]
MDYLWFDLSREELHLLSVSSDRFNLFRDFGLFSTLNDFENTYDNISFSDPVVAAVVAEQPSPAPAVPPQAIETEIEGTEMVSVPEPSLILGFITVGGLMLGSRKKAKA